jgi:D-3-phosphoglycerate dehydrogenase / 2-oxoglutarate reductase
MFKFLLYEPIHQAGIQVLESVGEVRRLSAFDEDTIIREIADIDGAIIRSQGGLTRRILEHAPKLKVAGRHGVGMDNVDIAAATEFGVQIVNTPLAVVEGVAEHTVGLMLALSKQLVYCDRETRRGNFGVRYEVMGREMLGRSVGIIGMGRIGRRVADICHRAFGMPILYSDVVPCPELERELHATRLEMDEVLSRAEYVSLHVPLLPETRGLIGEREFGLMRPDAMFFNTCRGPVVNEAALIKALQEKRILGAGLDVFEKEPSPASNPLFSMDNVVVTPHAATTTEEALHKMSLVAEDLVAVLQGRPPTFPVNRLPSKH